MPEREARSGSASIQTSPERWQPPSPLIDQPIALQIQDRDESMADRWLAPTSNMVLGRHRTTLERILSEHLHLDRSQHLRKLRKVSSMFLVFACCTFHHLLPRTRWGAGWVAENRHHTIFPGQYEWLCIDPAGWGIDRLVNCVVQFVSLRPQERNMASFVQYPPHLLAHKPLEPPAALVVVTSENDVPGEHSACSLPSSLSPLAVLRVWRRSCSSPARSDAQSLSC